MPSERLGLRAWLEHQLNTKAYRGVKWIDNVKGTFSISWKHASRHGWVENEDAAIFKDWAIHTGRYRENLDTPNPKTWKANFRCAMNASRDIKMVKDGFCKGKNACRIFEFSKNRKSRVKVSQRNVPTQLVEKEETESTVGLRSRNYSGDRKRNMRMATKRHKFVNINRMLNYENKKTFKSTKYLQPLGEEKPDCLHPVSEGNSGCLQTPREETKHVLQIHEETSTPTCKETSNSYTEEMETIGLKRNPKLYETRLFSFAEILEKIPSPKETFGYLECLPMQYNTCIAEYTNIEDEIFKDLLKYVNADMFATGDNTRKDFDDGLSYRPQSYRSTSETSDAEDIAEIFNIDYRNPSSTFKELESILRPRDEGEYEFSSILDDTEMPPISSINAPFFPTTFSSVISDPFLGQEHNKNEVTAALKTSFTYELQ